MLFLITQNFLKLIAMPQIHSDPNHRIFCLVTNIRFLKDNLQEKIQIQYLLKLILINCLMINCRVPSIAILYYSNLKNQID